MFGPRKIWQRALTSVLCLGILTQVASGAEQPSKKGQVRRVQYCPPVCQPQCPPGSMQPDSPLDSTESAPSSPSSSDSSSQSAPAPMNTPFQDQNFNNAPQPNFNPAPQNNAIASTNTSGFGSQAPNMIGDNFGTFGSILVAPGPIFFPTVTGNLGAAPGGNVGRLKLAENISPIPRDRVYVNYSSFQNVNILGGGVDVQRITPGFEKTFFDKTMSIEVRTPFADTISSTYDTAAPHSSTEFGNMSLWLKSLIAQNRNGAISAGLGLTLPTANDYRATNGVDLRVENSSVHFLPFIGGIYTPDDRWFTQGYVQLDIDESGNDIYSGGAFTARARDNEYLFASVSTGYWVYKADCRRDTIQGIAPIVEIHQNMTLDRGSAQGVSTERPGYETLTNAVLGINTQLSKGKTLTLGYTTPISGNDQFDTEIRVLFNWVPGT